MRDIITAFILGAAFANCLLMGAKTVNDGGVSWVFLLIVFPLASLLGMVSILLDYRKRASAQSRHPNSYSTDQQSEQPR